jgi:hypothetical protein
VIEEKVGEDNDKRRNDDFSDGKRYLGSSFVMMADSLNL